MKILCQISPILESFILYFLFYTPFIILAFIIVVGLAKYYDFLIKPEDEKTRRRNSQLRKYPDFQLDMNRGIENMKNEQES
ncbi:MAG: hypothetical protein ACW98U_11060 [Candidatus Thorarchaeota archaeon]|jgi:hypothetical protein